MDISAKAEEKKRLGNDEHKKGNYPAAVRLYTEAIGMIILTNYLDFNPNEPSYYTNRALSNI